MLINFIYFHCSLCNPMSGILSLGHYSILLKIAVNAKTRIKVCFIEMTIWLMLGILKIVRIFRLVVKKLAMELLLQLL